MPKFVFKLQGVLRQREQVERQRQRDLALKQREFVRLQEALERVKQTVASSNDDLRQNRLVGTLDMAFLAAHRRFLAGMQREALGIVQRIALAQRGVDEARTQLAEAAKAKKAIEKLREKHFDRWRADLARREREQSDEVGMQLAYEELTREPARAAGAGTERETNAS